MQDVYPSNTGEVINNGNIVFSIGGWYYDTKSPEDVKHTPTITTLSGQYDNDFIDA